MSNPHDKAREDHQMSMELEILRAELKTIESIFEGYREQIAALKAEKEQIGKEVLEHNGRLIEALEKGASAGDPLSKPFQDIDIARQALAEYEKWKGEK